MAVAAAVDVFRFVSPWVWMMTAQIFDFSLPNAVDSLVAAVSASVVLSSLIEQLRTGVLLTLIGVSYAMATDVFDIVVVSD